MVCERAIAAVTVVMRIEMAATNQAIMSPTALQLESSFLISIRACVPGSSYHSSDRLEGSIICGGWERTRMFFPLFQVDTHEVRLQFMQVTLYRLPWKEMLKDRTSSLYGGCMQAHTP